MKILILVLAASLCLAQDTSLVSGVLSGVSCATGSLSGCYNAASDAVSYFESYLRATTPAQSCTTSAASLVNNAASTYNSGLSWDGLTSLVSTVGSAIDTYTNCLTSSKLSAIPAELKTTFRKVASNLHNVAPKFESYVSTKTHEMGVKQFFYRGMDATHHIHALAGAYLTGNKLNGDKFFSFG